MRDILDPVMSGDAESGEGRQNGEQSVASRIPCDVRERTSVVVPVTEVVPLPSVCSTVDDPP